MSVWPHSLARVMLDEGWFRQAQNWCLFSHMTQRHMMTRELPNWSTYCSARVAPKAAFTPPGPSAQARLTSAEGLGPANTEPKSAVT